MMNFLSKVLKAYDLVFDENMMQEFIHESSIKNVEPRLQEEMDHGTQFDIIVLSRV